MAFKPSEKVNIKDKGYSIVITPFLTIIFLFATIFYVYFSAINTRTENEFIYLNNSQKINRTGEETLVFIRPNSHIVVFAGSEYIFGPDDFDGWSSIIQSEKLNNNKLIVIPDSGVCFGDVKNFVLSLREICGFTNTILINY